MPSTAPLYEQAKQVRKRAAWSDLRKGVLMLGVGLGLTFWSMLDDGTPNSVGLVLLFVGIGLRRALVLRGAAARRRRAIRGPGTIAEARSADPSPPRHASGAPR